MSFGVGVGDYMALSESLALRTSSALNDTGFKSTMTAMTMRKNRSVPHKNQDRTRVPHNALDTAHQAESMVGKTQIKLRKIGRMKELTPAQQISIMEQQRTRLQQQSVQARPRQSIPEQHKTTETQQNMVLQQQMNPQMRQRMQMQNMQGGTPIMQQQQQQQMNQAINQETGPEMLDAQTEQRKQVAAQARAQFMRTKQLILAMQSKGQPIPVGLQHRFQQQQQLLHAAQQQLSFAAARGKQPDSQQLQNLPNQQALLRRMQRSQETGRKGAHISEEQKRSPYNREAKKEAKTRNRRTRTEERFRQNAMTGGDEVSEHEDKDGRHEEDHIARDQVFRKRLRLKDEELLVPRDMSSPLSRSAPFITHRGPLHHHEILNPTKSMLVHATISSDYTGTGDLRAKVKLCALLNSNYL